MKIILLQILTLLTASFLYAQTPIKNVDTIAGEISISGEAENWDVSVLLKPEQNETQEMEIVLSAKKGELPPPELKLSWSVPQTDIHARWHSSVGYGNIAPEWDRVLESSLEKQTPILALLGKDNSNRLTFACSEGIRKVGMKAGIYEETSDIICEIRLFSEKESPIAAYKMSVFFDKRRQNFVETIQSAARWLEKFPENRPLKSPDDAFKPFYSTWYSYHHKFSAADIEKECALASKYGMKGVIVDGGWYNDTNKRGCYFWGDGKASKVKFPDMKEHVEKIHKMGMKYILWFGVPLVGYGSDASHRFEGKYIRDEKCIDCRALDPRFPEVREYIISTCEKILTEYDIDGFKFDFIDRLNWQGKDPAIAESYAGRDIKSLPIAVDFLLSSLQERLAKIKKGLLIEFRQPYIGSAIRKYGNMFRVIDCPSDAPTNLRNSVNIRLTSGDSAVHSDMVEWNYTTSAEDAARQLLAVLFTVPQISVKIAEIPESHRAMLKFYMNFITENSDILLKGKFTPRLPAQNYPQVSANKNGRTIVVVYGENQVVDLPASGICHIFNATSCGKITVKSPAKFSGNAFDVYGKNAGTIQNPAGLAEVDVPISGGVKLTIGQ